MIFVVINFGQLAKISSIYTNNCFESMLSCFFPSDFQFSYLQANWKLISGGNFTRAQVPAFIYNYTTGVNLMLSNTFSK